MLHFHGIYIYEASLQRAIPKIVQEVSDEVIIADQARCISTTGAHGLVEAQKDPSFKKQGDTNNPNRMMRALEVVLHTGIPLHQFHIQAENRGINSIYKITQSVIIILIMIFH